MVANGSMTEEHKAAIREGRERRLVERAAGKRLVKAFNEWKENTNDQAG